MADNLSKETRKKNMSHILSKGSKPEEIVRKALFSKGFRYRKNVKALPGCPDIVLPKYKTKSNKENLQIDGMSYAEWKKSNKFGFTVHFDNLKSRNLYR